MNIHLFNYNPLILVGSVHSHRHKRKGTKTCTRLASFLFLLFWFTICSQMFSHFQFLVSAKIFHFAASLIDWLIDSFDDCTTMLVELVSSTPHWYRFQHEGHSTYNIHIHLHKHTSWCTRAMFTPQRLRGYDKLRKPIVHVQ